MRSIRIAFAASCLLALTAFVSTAQKKPAPAPAVEKGATLSGHLNKLADDFQEAFDTFEAQNTIIRRVTNRKMLNGKLVGSAEKSAAPDHDKVLVAYQAKLKQLSAAADKAMADAKAVIPANAFDAASYATWKKNFADFQAGKIEEFKPYPVTSYLRGLAGSVPK